MTSQTKLKPTIFICRHGEREDYQWKAKGENWQAQADRPWDSPLTQGGCDQAAACGRAILRHCDNLGIAPVRKVFISPLFRCAQTGSAAASVLGVKELNLVPALAETMSEHWYRSWATPGADSTWGGKGTNSIGKPVERDKIHPSALSPASECFLNASSLTEMLQESGDHSIQITPTDLDCSCPLLPYTWDLCETHDEQSSRMLNFCLSLKDSDAFNGDEPYSVLLVSHGGPTTNLYASLTGTNKHPSTGYCGLFCYSWEEQLKKAEENEAITTGGWKALLIANHDHLQEVEGATMSGPNDMVEQAETPPSS